VKRTPHFLLDRPKSTGTKRTPLKKRVGGSLSKLPPLQRLEMLRRNAWMIRQKPWTPPANDGTVVRKVVGLAR